MDYIRGFREASEIYKEATDRIVKQLSESDLEREDYVTALDRFISTLYVLQFQTERMEEEYFESLIDSHCEGKDCTNCDDYNKDLEYDDMDIIDIMDSMVNDFILGFKTDKTHTKEEF